MYLKVLRHLKEFKVDRIVLDTFATPIAWSETGNSTLTVGTTNATINTNALKIDGITDGDTFYVALTQDVPRLDDRETIQLHITTSHDLSEGDLTLVFSQGGALKPDLVTIDLPDITAGNMELVELAIPTPKLLSSVKSVGLRANTSVSTVIYLGAIQATTLHYITTKEDVEEKIVEGENYVLSKLGTGATEVPEQLDDAVCLATAGKMWLRQKENENFQYDYGYISSKNYGVKLLNDAKVLVEQYLADGSIDESSGAPTKEALNTDLIGGNSVFDGNIT